MPIKLAAIAALVLSLTFTSKLSSQNINKSRGITPHIIAIGGGDDTKILSLFVKEAGGPSAKIVIVSAARKTFEKQTETALAYQAEFVKLGVPKDQITFIPILDKTDADNPNVFSLLSGASAAFFSGGDQRLLLERIYKTKFHEVLLDRVAEGMVYFGTSAGTAWLGPLCITRSDSVARELEVLPGLGIVDLVLDSHVRERKREWRLKQLLSKYSDLQGRGIDEGTALYFNGADRLLIDKEGEAHDLTAVTGLVRQD